MVFSFSNWNLFGANLGRFNSKIVSGSLFLNLRIQIIPINLVLQVTVSYLVATNTALAVNAISITKKSIQTMANEN